MAGFITRAQCADTVKALAEALKGIPDDAGALRQIIRTNLAEYLTAGRMYDRALEDQSDPDNEKVGAEIRALGSIVPYESIQLTRPTLVRRVTDRGAIVIVEAGKETWKNYSGTAAPIVVLRNIEAEG